jgi:hypothetical protein
VKKRTPCGAFTIRDPSMVFGEKLIGSRILRELRAAGYDGHRSAVYRVLAIDGCSEEMVNAIGDYGRVAVEHVVLAPDSGDVARVRDKMDQIARDVIPAFR